MFDIAAGAERAVRRPAFLFFRLERRSVVDFQHLVRGEVKLRPEERLEALALPDSAWLAIDDGELEVLRAASGEWCSAGKLARRCGIDAAVVDRLIDKGLLLSQDGDAESRTRRRREERLARAGWNPAAAMFHYTTRWQGTDYCRGKAEPPPLDFADRPPCPPPFYSAPQARGRIDLPLGERRGPFYRLLRQRRTVRHFATDRPLAQTDLASVLRYTYGCHGKSVSPVTEHLSKTSPSGGALHPIEAYPLLQHVEGLEPGLYHYDVEHHALEVLRPMPQEAAHSLAYRLTAGQSWFATAHVLFLLTARFARNFWKYHHHAKAYKALLMDAAHLSQTCYLVCTEMGLGAFFTAAVNDLEIEEALGLDPEEQGVVGLSGCGHPAVEQPLGLVAEPYQPPR